MEQQIRQRLPIEEQNSQGIASDIKTRDVATCSRRKRCKKTAFLIY